MAREGQIHSRAISRPLVQTIEIGADDQHTAFTHSCWSPYDQRPPPDQTPIPLGEENGFKPFSELDSGSTFGDFKKKTPATHLE